MKELIKLSITSALEGLNSKKFTSTELVDAHIAQATKCENLNAYITETFHHATKQAKQADQNHFWIW